MKNSLLLLILIAINLTSFGQELTFKKVALSDSIALANQMQQLAESCLKQKLSEIDLFRVQLISGNYKQAITTIEKQIKETSKEDTMYLEYYAMYAKAKSTANFNLSFKNNYESYLKKSDDFFVLELELTFVIRNRTARYIADFNRKYRQLKTGVISINDAQSLLDKYFMKTVYASTKDIVAKEIQKDHERRYSIDEEIIFTKDGAEISAIVIKRKGSTKSKESTLLMFSIYAEKSPFTAMISAYKGYVGMLAYSRGKRLNKEKIKPFDHENTDVYEVIDWISKQPWSNKKVGMHGGSYDGFTQWASMKHKVHPALKTIIPTVSIAPGIDYPMENNVLHNHSYSWNFYVTNNKYLDNEAINDRNRWESLKNTWYKTGVAFNKLDSIDGTVNKLWNKYMKHPSYDDYWKKMIPYKEEFAKIDIPILTITGYYDDSQRGAMYYYKQHHKYVKNPNHYLLVGPYDHWTSQDKPMEYLRNYKLDKSALINLRYDVTYQWFDYILKGKKKPSILKDKVNFQVMDTDTWMHKSSLSAMTNDTLTFHLSATKIDQFYALKAKPNSSEIEMNVDFKDRESMNNTEYYPWPLERKQINLKDGLIFKSEALKEDVIINGSFLGNLEFSINKKDVDYSVILYQLTPENKYFHLSYYIGRASFAKDKEQRNLLVPNQKTQVSFNNSKPVVHFK